MPILSDEDVGLGSSYLTDEDVGLGGGDETWSPEEQARLEAEDAGLAPETGFRAGLRRLRASPTGQALLGPTQAEREGGAMSTGSPGEIAETMLKFTAVPPQLANPIRSVTDPAIEMLPAGVGGVVQGARELALNLPLAPIPVAPRAVMGAFAGEYLAGLPEAKQAYEEALERGDTKEAANIATQTVGGGALLGLGGAHEAMRFKPVERGGIPKPITGEPINAQRIREDTGQPKAAREVAQGSEANRGSDVQQAPPKTPTETAPQNAPQEPSPVLLSDKSEWTKATDTENLKAATPEQRVAAAVKPLDVDSFLTTDKEGFKAVDTTKLRGAVEGGHITSGNAASDALLLHLIKDSDLHPLNSIRLLDFTPGEAQLLTGTEAPFHGRFSKKANKRSAMIELTMKQQSGEPVTTADFMETLTHELGHNAITSKFKDAPAEIQRDVDNLFKHVKEQGKGTEFENHNALTNAHELFAELADPKIHKWLSELDYSGDIRKVDVGVASIPAISPPAIRNSALGRFLEIAKKLLKLPDFITDAFGNKVETITALDQMVSLSSRLERVRRTGGEPESELNAAKSFKDAIKEAESVSNEELVKQGGSVTQFMWKLGAKAKTAEDVATLKRWAEESAAKAEKLIKAGDYEEAMAIAGRQPAEAYEYATGVKVDGQPKWAAFEKVNPSYVPAVPDAKYLEAKGGAAKVEPVAAVAPSSSEPSAIEPQQPTSPTISEVSAGDKLISGAPEGKGVGQIPIVEGVKSQKWTGATEEAPAKPGETLGGQTYAGFPNPAAVVAGIKRAVKDFGPGVKAAAKVVADATKAIYKENLSIRKMGDLDRSVLKWSSKMQRSFGESMSAQKEIQSVAKTKVKDEALANWMEAGGDRAKLTAWRDGSTDPKLRAGYEAALNLSPGEVAMAGSVRSAYDQLFARAERWGLVDKDPTKPSSFRDDYVTHLWDLGKEVFAGGSRTLKDQFKFAKARTFQNYFEGEQAGFKPKTKRLSQIFPIYLHELNSVIAAKQMVKEMGKGVASDGRPLLAPRGIAQTVAGAKGEAVLVRPNTPRGDTKDYKVMANQPALHDWVWAGKDTAGNPIFEKSDLALHPEAYKKLQAILGKSKIREWYSSEGSATAAVPKAITKGLDIYQSETKRTMLGLISPFHQVQEGTHAIGHRINPFFNVPKPNMENPVHLDLAKHGLMILPDRASERNFTEGLRPSGLVSFIPGVGKVADFYSNYLFHEYIPGLKIKTALAIVERNKKVYAKELAAGTVSLEDVKLLSTTQANAAYGHLNYADLGRDPTIQHILQLGLLAPDFLEARGRFAGQAIKGVGGKVGREQLLALATLAVAQAALAYTSAKLTDGEWEGTHPFEFRKGNRRYTMRSVPEDVARLLTDTRAFVYNRLNPITAVGPLQLGTGRDRLGRKVSAGQTAKQLALAPVPLTARGFLGIDKSPLEDWEQLAGAAGLKIMRYSPQNEVRKLLNDWKKSSENPKLVAQAEQAEAQTFGESEYSDLRQAMERDNFQMGAKAYEKLLETHTAAQVKRAMNPVSVDPGTGTYRDRMLPKELEFRFLSSLGDKDREVYEAAKRQRKVLYQRFQRMVAE